MQLQNVFRVAIFSTTLIGCEASAPDEASSEQASVIVTPTAFDFGTVPLGSASSTHAVTVQPDAGPTEVSVTAVTPASGSCGGFAIAAPPLPAPVGRTCQESCAVRPCVAPLTTVCDITTAYDDYTFGIVFRPTAAGTVTCNVAIRMFDFMMDLPTTTIVALTGTGK